VPTGLAASEDTLWVADWATGIVWQVGFDGKTPLVSLHRAHRRAIEEI